MITDYLVSVFPKKITLTALIKYLSNCLNDLNYTFNVYDIYNISNREFFSGFHKINYFLFDICNDYIRINPCWMDKSILGEIICPQYRSTAACKYGKTCASGLHINGAKGMFKASHDSKDSLKSLWEKMDDLAVHMYPSGSAISNWHYAYGCGNDYYVKYLLPKTKKQSKITKNKIK